MEFFNNYGPILFFTNSGSGGTERLRIDGSGNVGIGTTTPSYRLHIRGDNTSGGGFPILKLENAQTGGHSCGFTLAPTESPAIWVFMTKAQVRIA